MEDPNVINDEVATIVEQLSKLRIDLSSTQGQEIEQDKYDWYINRFKMLKEDGCPDAINSYLRRLQKDDVNDYTRVLVIRASMDIMWNGGTNE